MSRKGCSIKSLVTQLPSSLHWITGSPKRLVTVGEEGGGGGGDTRDQGTSRIVPPRQSHIEVIMC